MAAFISYDGRSYLPFSFFVSYIVSNMAISLKSIHFPLIICMIMYCVAQYKVNHVFIYSYNIWNCRLYSLFL